jgi:hypothetical protein
MCTKNKYIIIAIFSIFLFSNCINNGVETDKGVECRLYWISDSYPIETESAEEDDFRMISLHYIIVNNTKKEFFLPINRSISLDMIDTAYCSEMIASIDKKPIDTWFSTDIRWRNILKSGDSIHANLKIPEGRLEHVNIKKSIRLDCLLNCLELKYSKCLSDTIFSTKPIPQLHFTNNDTIAIHYRDTVIKKSADIFTNIIK